MSEINVLRDIQEQMEYQQKRLKFYNEQAEFILPLQALMEEAEGNLNVTSYSIDLSVTGGMGLLYGLVERLEEYGYKPTKDLPEKTETYWFCRLQGADESYPSVYLAFSNNLCVRVQVGTRMEEVPVYEVKCSE